jgi:peptidoglycan/xylan/chitin deacetylase (PgdA/CDA1 family)
VAEILSRHELRGTFFVPIRNSEGLPVMSSSNVQQLKRAGFEIGSHTFSHRRLTILPRTELWQEINQGKRELEDVVGGSVQGFCYPGGKSNRYIRRAVSQAGFRYARTIANFRLDLGGDDFDIPTTLQVFPHTKRVLASNFIRGRNYTSRARAFAAAISARVWWERLPRIAATLKHDDSIVHLWGHSWEIEKHSLWQALDVLLGHLAECSRATLTVGEALSSAKGCPFGSKRGAEIRM